jgi:hypothetical protein
MKVILEAHRGHYYIRYLGCILSSKMRIVFVHYKIKSFYNVSVCFRSNQKSTNIEWSVDIKCLYELEIQMSPRAIDVLRHPNFAIWIP